MSPLCTWSDWKAVLGRSWPGRVRTCRVGLMSSGELLSEAAMLRWDLRRRGIAKYAHLPFKGDIDQHHSEPLYGRLRSLEDAQLWESFFEQVGTLLALTPPDAPTPLSTVRYHMPGELPPEMLRDAPPEFQALVRKLAT